VDAEVITWIGIVVLLTLLLVECYAAKRRQRPAREEQGHTGSPGWKDVLVLKHGETVVGVIERRPRKYAFVTLDVTKSTRADDH